MSRSVVVVAIALFSWTAWAQAAASDHDDPTDPYALPDAPAPPTLPDLTHRALAVSLDTTFASIHGNTTPEGADPGRSFGWNERIEAEQAVSIRRWYVGVSEQLALGKPPGGDFLLVAANPEVWGRALWASQAGLAYGGGLGLVLPGVPHGTAGTEVAQTIRAIRPWDYVQFVNDDLIFRPFIDVRDIDGRVLLQLRQGIDWDRASGALTSRTTFYVGYRPTQLFGVGLEAWEVYLIQAPFQKDDGRAAYAVSPNIRFMTRVLQPAFSVLLPIDRPLFDAAKDFWAVRLSVSVILEPRPSPLSPASDGKTARSAPLDP
jgi:hypothetical protein